MSETFVYGIIWGLISFALGMWFFSMDFWLTNILGYITGGFGGLCIARAFRLM
ncbi:hypothetical protein N9F35_00990 [Gammaproteobacteria bacterium]|jgi:hypothetical protein|nr:hypothetical protein [Gammaproteobacteria bacterium]MDC1008256.1 hypothetical protein [Gammaproteobacteria bacterium]|tara:strand:- start:101 stop:259 length:159 start_codon:yes stop_codon:yes gene_type:complete